MEYGIKNDMSVFVSCTKNGVCQGDIFVRNIGTNNEELGIVVTGNCDISHNKCCGIISYCCIMSTKNYIRENIIKEIVEKKLNSWALEKKVLLQKKMAASDFSIENFNFIASKALPEIKQIIEDSDLADDVFLYGQIRKADVCDFDIYKKVCKLVKKEFDIEELRKTVKNKICNLPGDVFFLGKISDFHSENTYMVDLRQIRTIEISKLAYPDNSVLKICKLNYPFISSLTQKLGAVFSDIGLPEEFDEYRKNEISHIGEELNELYLN